MDSRLVEAERPPERLVDLRAEGRADFGVAVRGLDAVDLGLVVFALGRAEDELLPVDLARDEAVEVLVVDLLAVVLGFAAALLAVVDATGFAADIVLAAAVSALAAVVMALVAVFMACMADDMVFADDVALVAAAVILVAAVVTLVAAEDTVLAADAGVAVLLDEELRVDREVLLRVDRPALLRVERVAVLRAVREAGLRPVEEVVLPIGMSIILRDAVDLERLVVDLGRLAVPDALRLTDLLRAVLAELRRVAARVVV